MQCAEPFAKGTTMAIKITIEGDDKDELLAAAQALVEMLGGEAEEEVLEDEPEEESDPEEDPEPEEEDESDKTRAMIKKYVLALTKKPGGVEKIRKSFALGKAKKLDQMDDKYLPKVLAALKKK